MRAAMLPQARGTGQRQVGVSGWPCVSSDSGRGRGGAGITGAPVACEGRRWRYWFLPRMDAGWPGSLSVLPVLMTRMPFLVCSTFRMEMSLSL